MALVGKIREKSGLIVFVVGLGLLLFIIPFDTIYQNFQGSGEKPIGEIYGKPIYDSKWNFNARAQNMMAQYAGLPEDYKFQQETQFWNQLMVDTLFKTEIAKIGLQVGQNELVEKLILGDFPDEQLIEAYSFDGPNGEKEFRKDSVKAWYDNIVGQRAAATGEERNRIEAYIVYNIELPFKEARLKKKYNAMAKYGVIATDSEAKRALIENNASVDISFVSKEASAVQDSLVKVSDKDLKAYFETHKAEAKWKMNDDVRGYTYVAINITPSEADKAALMTDMEKLKEAFKQASNDSSFVNANAETKIGQAQDDQTKLDVMPRDEFDKSRSMFAANITDTLDKAPKGAVVGPFAFVDNNGTSKVLLAKITNSFVREETEVRHILISTEGLVEGVNDVELAKKSKLADSIVALLKKDNSKFAMLGTQFSEDPGFASNQGYYNVFPDAGLVPEFKNFALDNTVGSIKSVKTQFGYHVMEITKRGEFTHNYLALVDKNVVASKATKDEIFELQGLAFMEKAKGDFSKAAAEFGLEPVEDELYLSYPISQQLNYLGDLIEWSFTNGRKVGDISSPIETKTNQFVIAKLTKVANYGAPTFEAVSKEMRAELLKIKKIEYLTNLVKDVKTLEEATQKLPGVGAIPAEFKLSLNMDAYSGNGADPKAVAKTFLISNLNTVNVVSGDNGVYVVVVKNRTIVPPPAEIAEEKAKLTKDRQAYVERGLVMSLVKAADMRDWRMKSKIAYNNN